MDNDTDQGLGRWTSAQLRDPKNWRYITESWSERRAQEEFDGIVNTAVAYAKNGCDGFSTLLSINKEIANLLFGKLDSAGINYTYDEPFEGDYHIKVSW